MGEVPDYEAQSRYCAVYFIIQYYYDLCVLHGELVLLYPQSKTNHNHVQAKAILSLRGASLRCCRVPWASHEKGLLSLTLCFKTCLLYIYYLTFFACALFNTACCFSTLHPRPICSLNTSYYPDFTVYSDPQLLTIFAK